jgi:hypothetical protein
VIEFLQQIEQSSFPSWIRESPSVFAFPVILLLHTIGMGVIVGVSAGIDLRILGLAPAIRIAPLEKYLPILWIGFWVNAVTGTLLLSADASMKLTNPDFWAKMLFIALAIINLRLLKTHVFRDPMIDKGSLTTKMKILAATSLFFWLGAITTGRLLAYVGQASGYK